MANRLRMAKVHSIQTLRSQGWSQRRIARTLGVDRETVARYVHAAAAELQNQPNPPAGSDEHPPIGLHGQADSPGHDPPPAGQNHQTRTPGRAGRPACVSRCVKRLSRPWNGVCPVNASGRICEASMASPAAMTASNASAGD